MSTPNPAGLLAALKHAYPQAHCALRHQNPFQLLVSTILSAQCTDKRVNQVTPGLFRKFPAAAHFAGANRAELEQEIRSTGFYRGKARAIHEASRAIVNRFGGQVPRKLEDLIQLRGVGRKTANVILGNAFGVPAVVVDTHVKRLSYRMGLTRETDPVKIEFALMKVIPKRHWTQFSHEMISHGRAICLARNPKCAQCPVEGHCPKRGLAPSAKR